MRDLVKSPGKRTTRRLCVEALEERRVLSVGVTIPLYDGGGLESFGSTADALEFQLAGTALAGTAQDPIDLGVVDECWELPYERPVDEELWYRLRVIRDGFLSVQAFEQQDDSGDPQLAVMSSSFSIHLYEVAGDGELIELASGTGGVDYAEAVVGIRYVIRVTDVDKTAHVRIANLVGVDRATGTVEVFGHGEKYAEFFGGEKLVASFESANVVIINGFYYAFDAEQIETILLHDIKQVVLNGSDGDDTFYARPVKGDKPPIPRWIPGPSLKGAWGEVFVTWSEMLYTSVTAVGGGGHDTAYFVDSPKTKTFVASPEKATMTYEDVIHSAVGFETVSCGSHYNYTVELHDSAGDDLLEVEGGGSVTLSGDGYSIRVGIYGSRFTNLSVYASDGFDTAKLIGSGEYDTLTAWASSVKFRTARVEWAQTAVWPPSDPRKIVFPVSVEAVGFDMVNASAFFYKGDEIPLRDPTGNDVVKLYDSEGDDTFTATPQSAKMEYSSGQIVQALGFRFVHAYSNEGGTDAAVFFDSNRDDVFTATPIGAKMQYGGNRAVVEVKGFTPIGAKMQYGGNRAVVEVKGFHYVHAYATAGGYDVARLYDSAGDDTFTTTPQSAKMEYGSGQIVQALDFRLVDAYSNEGGTDGAVFFDSNRDDVFTATPIGAKMQYGNRAVVRVKGFHYVHAYATAGGRDVARLYDSAGDDRFKATGTCSKLIYEDGAMVRARHFDAVLAYANRGGRDVAKLYDSPGNDRLKATPRWSRLIYEDGTQVRAKLFDHVHAFAGQGGRDVAVLYDSPGNDQFVASPVYARLSGEGFFNRAKFFDVVHAFAGAGGYDEAVLYGSLGNDVFQGTPQYSTLAGKGYFNRVHSFEKVLAEAGASGYDEAVLYDSEKNDFLTAQENYAQLASSGLLETPWNFGYRVTGFDYVKAVASTGDDWKSVGELTFQLELEGDWINLTFSIR